MSQLHRVCVFTGSSLGGHPAYREATEALARAAHAAGLGIVYGGASVGQMGVLANTALSCGTEVVGVIPQSLVDREIAHPGLSELHVVDTMHERKARMAELSDAFVALPGGAGTLEELFEVYTWSQLGLHAKPCALLNVRGYYDSLAGFLDHAVAEGFLRPELRATLLMGEDPAALLDELAAWEPTTASKWATGARG